MGRRIKLDRYDDDIIIRETVKDDRKQADKVENKQQLDKLLDRNGAVANEIQDRPYGEHLVGYNADGTRKVEKERVKREITGLKQEIVGARGYSKRYTDTIIDQQLALDEDGKVLTGREKRNLNARRYQVRAKALLTLARVGEVEISSYDKGILNGLAAGQYDDVVYGKQDRRGQRRYERGTLVSEYERNNANYSVRSSDPAGRARAAELTERLREANRGGGASRTGRGSFYDEIRRDIA